MAKRLNEETAAEVGHNQLSPEERDVLIQQAIDEFNAIDAERKATNAVFTKRRKSTVSMVRGQLGYTMKVFTDEFLNPVREKDDHENEESWQMRLEAKAEAARFLKIGEQMELFGSQAKKQTRAASAKAKNNTGRKKIAAKNGHAAAPAQDPADMEVDDDFDDDKIIDTVAQAGKKGFEAGLAAEPVDDNPYPNGSRHRQTWHSHYMQAQTQRAREIKPTRSAAH